METTKNYNPSLEPFLKWAGGKRWLIHSPNIIAPLNYERYIEPFLGGASMFFSLPTKKYIIADLNEELINCYAAIKGNYLEVEAILKKHHKKHNKEYYYKIRAYKPRKTVTKAARFIYLNRTCWNGLYRVNLKGQFNVPIGTKNKVLLNSDNFEQISKRLQDGEIISQDFESTIGQAKKGDFVFIDPPYTVKHNLNGFLKYNEKIFSWDDQVRLKQSILSAVQRGVMVTVTNADHKSIHDLYSDICEIEKVERRSVISGKSSGRGLTTEVIMRIGWSI